MRKLPWMRDVEITQGWRDLWLGAWLRGKDGRWVRFETLADLWEWSDVLCSCCQEPLLITPDRAYLVCQWTAELTLVSSANHSDLDVSAFPCPACFNSILERRSIEDGLTTIEKMCSCGYQSVVQKETIATDYLPVGYVCHRWQEQTEYQTITGQLAEIKQMLKEQKR